MPRYAIFSVNMLTGFSFDFFVRLLIGESGLYLWHALDILRLHNFILFVWMIINKKNKKLDISPSVQS